MMAAIRASAVPPGAAPKPALRSNSRGSISPSNSDRRGFLAAALALAAAPASGAEGTKDLTPYQRGFRLEYGLDAAGRVRACDAAGQPNCVSTSSRSDLYSPPWLSPVPDSATAAEEFESALRGLSPDAELLEASDAPGGGIYRRYRIPSPFEYDIIEVLIAPQRPPYDAEPPLVTFRFQAGTVKYVWPITQPISDLGAQKKRVAELRRRLGWRLMGGDCDVLECFKE